MTVGLTNNAKCAYILRLADDLLVDAQRLAEFVTHGPELEEELAVANVSLDNLGVAQALYSYVAELTDGDQTADDLAFMRDERQFVNCLLVEQPHRDFADVMVRQFFLDAWHLILWPALESSSDELLAAVAAKAAKEARYHFRHSSSWVVRLGDGTAESKLRAQRAVDDLWRFAGELLLADEVDAEAAATGIGISPDSLADAWRSEVISVLGEATLRVPDDPFVAEGGRSGRHTEHLGHLLAEMQYMQRAYPGMQW
ncbi:MAG: phenylacetate-CoA oxygenase subunit PaaC [Acidimicrobiia bacterium]|nr:phenylacetate-CoA oxygenase subunit PaaC [Acidimicrobiia bacterium]